MLATTAKWSHARGNEVVPSRWQMTPMSGDRLARVVVTWPIITDLARHRLSVAMRKSPQVATSGDFYLAIDNRPFRKRQHLG